MSSIALMPTIPITDLIFLSKGIRQLSWKEPLNIERDDLNEKVREIWEQRRKNGDTASKAYLEKVFANISDIRDVSDLATIACAIDDLANDSEIIRKSHKCKDIFMNIVARIPKRINSDEIADFAFSCRNLRNYEFENNQVIDIYNKLFNFAIGENADFSNFTPRALARTIKGFVQAFVEEDKIKSYYLSIKKEQSDVAKFFKLHSDAVKQKIELFEATDVVQTIWSYGYAYEDINLDLTTKNAIQKHCKDAILELADLAKKKITQMSLKDISRICISLSDIGACSNEDLFEKIRERIKELASLNDPEKPAEWEPAGIATMLKFAAREEPNQRQEDFFISFRDQFIEKREVIYKTKNGETDICRGAHGILIQSCSQSLDDCHEAPLRVILEFIAQKISEKPIRWRDANICVVQQLFLCYVTKFGEMKLSRFTRSMIRGILDKEIKGDIHTSTGQRELWEFLNKESPQKNLFGLEVLFEGIYSIDIGSEKLKIAVEYDGPTHFDYNNNQRKEYNIKDNLLRLKGWRIFRIRDDVWKSLRTKQEKIECLRPLFELIQKSLW